MKQSKNLLKGLLGIALMAVIIVILWVVYDHYKPATTEGSKEVTVEVVIPDEDPKEFTLHTDAEYLREALEEVNLIKGSESEYGLFITEVNGRVADDSNQEWWCLTKNGQTVNTGVDATPIADGEKYELTLTVGY
jgi:hypothetical protein